MLLLVNALPFRGLSLAAGTAGGELGKTDWGKTYVVAAGAFGTLVTPFLITLNNHTFGTFSRDAGMVVGDLHLGEECAGGKRRPGTISLGRIFRLVRRHQRIARPVVRGGDFRLAGVVESAPTLFWPCRQPLIPVLGFFATNYAAIGQWQTAYAEFDSPTCGTEYEGSHCAKAPRRSSVKPGIDFARNKETRANTL